MTDRLEPRIREVADLHRRTLPGSLLSLLGRRAVASYYDFVSGSDREMLLVEQDGGKVLGVCVLSHAPASLGRRLLAARPLGLGWPLLSGALASTAVRKAVRAMAKEDDRPVAVANLPEVVQLFTAEDARGRGIGKRLLSRVEERLAQGGADGYYVKTEADADNAAIGFYERRGFTRAAPDGAGGDFIFLERSLSRNG